MSIFAKVQANKVQTAASFGRCSSLNFLSIFVAMGVHDLGRFVPGPSGNPGGRPKPPDGLKTRLAELSPRAVERLGELLDSGDERVRLEAAKTILDRHLGRPAIQADINLQGAEDAHIAALLATARRRALEPILLEDVEAEVSTTTPSAADPSDDAGAVDGRHPGAPSHAPPGNQAKRLSERRVDSHDWRHSRAKKSGPWYPRESGPRCGTSHYLAR